MNLDEIAPYRICLNLPQREDRRKDAWEEFTRLSMDVVRFPAISAHRVSSTWGYKSPARYACSLSKRLALRMGKKSGASAILLMEDDVVFLDDFYEHLADIDVPEDWEILFLGCRHLERPVIVAPGLVRVTRAADHHAMIVRSSVITKVIRALAGHRKISDRRIDFSDVKMSEIQKSVVTYACYPNLAWQKNTYSDNSKRELTHYFGDGRQKTDLHAVSGLMDEMHSRFHPKIPKENDDKLKNDTKDLECNELEKDASISTFNNPPLSIPFPSWNFLRGIPAQHHFAETFPLSFYINLPRREDRRMDAEFQFALQGIQVERLPAANGERARKTRGHGNPNKYACRLSHRMAIRQAKLRKAPSVLIFEDDVVLHPFFRDILERLSPPTDWGILFFGCTHVKPPVAVTPGWVKVSYLWGLQAYVVKAEWYDLVLKALREHGRPGVKLGSDVAISLLSDRIPMYATYPNIAWQAEGYSDLMKIQRMIFDKNGQQTRMLHVIREVNQQMRDLIASKYGDSVIDDHTDAILQDCDVRSDNINPYNNAISNRASAFRSIYAKNTWGSGSGPGSDPEYTLDYRKFLSDYIKQNRIKSILDVGCGDWQFSRLLDWSGVDYLGVDIVPELVEANIQNFGGLGVTFKVLDLVDEDPPCADLVIIKDVLQHLSFSAVDNILRKLQKFKRVLIVQDVGGANRDCNDGGYRPLNVTTDPFNLMARKVFTFMDMSKIAFEWIPDLDFVDRRFDLLELLSDVRSGHTTRYGPKRDGGYAVPSLEYDKIISVGVGNDVEFEIEYSDSHPTARFFFFDPTINHLPKSVANSEFYTLGLGADFTNRFISLREILSMCQITSENVILLKIDCEGGEWDGDIEHADLSVIAAIVIEIHNIGYSLLSGKQWSVLTKLYKEFNCVNAHPNNFGGFFLYDNIKHSRVIELTFLNKNIIQTETNTPINYPCNPLAEEFRLVSTKKL